MLLNNVIKLSGQQWQLCILIGWITYENITWEQHAKNSQSSGKMQAWWWQALIVMLGCIQWLFCDQWNQAVHAATNWIFVAASPDDVWFVDEYATSLPPQEYRTRLFSLHTRTSRRLLLSEWSRFVHSHRCLKQACNLSDTILFSEEERWRMMSCGCAHFVHSCCIG